jgi:hypothetical protein
VKFSAIQAAIVGLAVPLRPEKRQVAMEQLKLLALRKRQKLELVDQRVGMIDPAPTFDRQTLYADEFCGVFAA